MLRDLQDSVGHLMENAVSFEKVEELSYTDNLTGLANRRYFNKRLEEEGYTVLRFWASAVEANPAGIADKVEEKLRELRGGSG